jgi:hypothetical protein
MSKLLEITIGDMLKKQAGEHPDNDGLLRRTGMPGIHIKNSMK